VESIVNGIDALLMKSAYRIEDLKSIGFGVPGTVDPESGIVIFAPNLKWRDFELVKHVHQVFEVPICITQDTRAAAWAEFLIGAGRGFSSVASVTLGTGIGCGMVLNGSIFHGALNTAGEFGHMIVELNGKPCNCGRRGCLEAHAGGLAIVHDARRLIDGISLLVQKDMADIGVEDVFRLALEGHTQAREITDRVVNYLGMGLVNLINLTSIELVTISGGISNAPDDLLMNPLLKFVQARAYELVAAKVRVCKSSLGEDAPMIGAALLHRDTESHVLRSRTIAANN
jgi:glucokinase